MGSSVGDADLYLLGFEVVGRAVDFVGADDEGFAVGLEVFIAVGLRVGVEDVGTSVASKVGSKLGSVDGL